MTLLLLPYPDIKPEIFSIGPFAIRWYALAYIAGLVIGWQIMRRVCRQPPKVLSPEKTILVIVPVCPVMIETNPPSAAL